MGMTDAQVKLIRQLIQRERDYQEAIRDNDIQRTGLPILELFGAAIRTGRTLERAGLLVAWNRGNDVFCKLVDSSYPGIPNEYCEDQE